MTRASVTLELSGVLSLLVDFAVEQDLTYKYEDWCDREDDLLTFLKEHGHTLKSPTAAHSTFVRELRNILAQLRNTHAALFDLPPPPR